MNTRPFYPFLPAIFFTIFPAFCAVTWLVFDDAAFCPHVPAEYFLSLASPFVFIGLIGLAFRQSWALWLCFMLWVICLSFSVHAWFCDARNAKTFFPMYWWLYKQLFWYFSASILSCVFGLWQCNRLKRVVCNPSRP